MKQSGKKCPNSNQNPKKKDLVEDQPVWQPSDLRLIYFTLLLYFLTSQDTLDASTTAVDQYTTASPPAYFCL